MKKRHFFAVSALIITLLLIFVGCNEKTPSPEGEGGSDIAVSDTPNNVTVVETTAADSNPRYSASDKLIALTFDDGPHSVYTNKILDVLEKNGATATFFIVGYNIDGNIDTIRRAQTLGCEIGNHSNDHKNLTECNYLTLRSQVDSPNKKIKKLTDTEMTLFRAPGGAYKGIKELIGMPIIHWSIDTEDWKAKDSAHKDRTEDERNTELKRIADNVVHSAKKGDIILMHDIYNFTADLSEIIVPQLIENGFKVVSVSEMYEAYGEALEDGEIYSGIKFPTPATTTNNNAILETGNYKVRTNGGKLNVRIEPKQESESIKKLPNGESVTVIKSIPGWSLVKAPGASGWVNSAYLEK